MGKRLVRIFASDIPAKISSLVNLELNLVLFNKRTFHGKITKADNGKVEVVDYLSGKHSLAVSEISEIVYDKEASY